MATGGGGPPQTFSLECTNPNCMLGVNGAKYKCTAICDNAAYFNSDLDAYHDSP